MKRIQSDRLIDGRYLNLTIDDGVTHYRLHYMYSGACDLRLPRVEAAFLSISSTRSESISIAPLLKSARMVRKDCSLLGSGRALATFSRFLYMYKVLVRIAILAVISAILTVDLSEYAVQYFSVDRINYGKTGIRLLE